MRRHQVLLLLPLLLSLVACATTQTPVTAPRDLRALVGVWEEEWPGQPSNDRYRIEVVGEQVTITPLTNADKQQVRDVVFRKKQLDFILELDGSPVFYNLVLVTPKLLSGRAKGSERNFDEPVRWYKIS